MAADPQTVHIRSAWCLLKYVSQSSVKYAEVEGGVFAPPGIQTSDRCMQVGMARPRAWGEVADGGSWNWPLFYLTWQSLPPLPCWADRVGRRGQGEASLKALC